MCGRTALNVNARIVRRCTGLRTWVDPAKFRPTTNVAPTSFQPVIVPRSVLTNPSAASTSGHEVELDVLPNTNTNTNTLVAESSHVIASDNANQDGSIMMVIPGSSTPVPPAVPPASIAPLFDPAGSDTDFVLFSMKWGLVTAPSLARGGPQPINARDDSVIEGKPMFAGLRHRGRCVVIAQGFYEWVRTGSHKSAYFVRPADGSLLYLAGLFTTADVGQGEHLYSYTLITTENTPALAFLHDRMPVILSRDGVRQWLDPNVTQWNTSLAQLLRPDDTGLVWYEVDPRIGKAGVHDAGFMTPYVETKRGEGRKRMQQWLAGGSGGHKLKEPAIVGGEQDGGEDDDVIVEVEYESQ